MSDELDAADAAALPAVARTASPWPMRAGIVGVLVLGLATFQGLNSARAVPDTDGLPAAGTGPSSSNDLPPPPVLASPPVAAAPAAEPPPAPPPAAPPRAEPPPPRGVTPAVIVDLSAPEAAKPVDADGRTAPPADKLNSNEAFAARVSGTGSATVGTEQLSSTDYVVPQGTVIVAVLETAINSDLPGLVRAVVTRDVRGLDASKVLIPRGSRLIGQYSNGVALGQSRAFVIWTRLLRDDGVSIQLGSAATDPLGTAGLTGRVNSHSLRRYGAAALLSVVTSGLDYLVATANRGSSVSIGSPTQATQLAGIALQKDIDIPPTIKVAQGTPVRVFVARDLDFGATRKP